jgi:hypothetical protein
MQQLQLPELRAQIETLFASADGSKSAEKYWELTDINVSIWQRRIEIKGQTVTIINQERTEVPHNKVVSNWSYRVPVVTPVGQPVMIEETYLDENKQEQTRIVQKTVGEADTWLLKFLPLVWPAVELGMLGEFNRIATNPITYQEPA